MCLGQIAIIIIHGIVQRNLYIVDVALFVLLIVVIVPITLHGHGKQLGRHDKV